MSQSNVGAQNELVSFVGRVVGEEPLRVDESLGLGYVRLRVSEAERRQAKQDIRCVESAVIELLRNARDARAAAVFIATAREGSQRTLVCIDDGDGIPRSMHERVFEARVTSRLDTMRIDDWGVHGRGMALYSIAQNSMGARVVASDPGCGTSVSARFDCTVLGERADQSTWPTLVPSRAADEAHGLRGPHNIARTCVEFALSCEGTPSIYLGSPTEVLATMCALGGGVATASTGSSKIALWRQMLGTPDAAGVGALAAKLGIPVSERTAYRVAAGEIAPLEPIHRRYVAPEPTTPAVDLERDARGLKVAENDLADFTSGLKEAFSVLHDRYYIGLKGDPRVRVTRDTVTVTFDIQKEQ